MRPNPIAGLIAAPRGYSYEPDRPLCPAFTARSGLVQADDRATISIFDYIGDGGFSDARMAAALRSVGADRPVTVEINSPGGDYFQGVAIFNMLLRHRGAVTVQILGQAASAASLIAMAGTTVEIARNAQLMIHNAWSIAIGNKAEFTRFAAMLSALDSDMADVYAARAETDLAQITGWMDAETYFSGPQAVEAGLADAILARDAEELAFAEMPDTVRAWDRRLAEQRPLTRSERRALFAQISGKRDAAPHQATQDAGLSDLAAQLRRLQQTF